MSNRKKRDLMLYAEWIVRCSSSIGKEKQFVFNQFLLKTIEDPNCADLRNLICVRSLHFLTSIQVATGMLSQPQFEALPPSLSNAFTSSQKAHLFEIGSEKLNYGFGIY